MNDHRNLMRRVIMILLLAAAVILMAVYFRYQHTSSRRPPDLYDGNIPQFHSSADRDGDGIDDQQDILDGALAYVSAHPKYKSRYYNGGYPDDDYGVCTDLAAAALKSAGYDLMELVSEDISKHPSDYDIDVPDKNVDYRRVKNLIVYFKNNAVSLTADISDIEEWQGGDIVIFKNHIGIISDRRDKDGIPYVIHHNDPWQTSYEQDILGSRKDIVGHYRMSE